MRFADFLTPYSSRLTSLVEFDSLGLRLSRYLPDLEQISWDGDPISRDALVLASIRAAPQFFDDLTKLHEKLQGAEVGTLMLLCLENDFGGTPIPGLLGACDRNGWQIQHVGGLATARVRIGLLMEVRSPTDAVAMERLRLHNALVVSDYERRWLAEQLETALRSAPKAVPLAKPTDSREIGALKSRVEELKRQRNTAEHSRKQALDELQRLRESVSLLVGWALVKALRHPKYLLRLPAELTRTLWHRRGLRKQQKAMAPTVSKALTPPSEGAGRHTTSVATSSATPFVRFPADPARMRIATIGRRQVVERLSAGAEVLRIHAGVWLAEPHRRVTAADVLIVDACAGASSGSWAGLGEPGEVDRTRELIAVLDAATSNGIPSVLLVRNDHVPIGLRALQGRFSVTLPWEFGPAGWDPGIPLSQLSSPVDSERLSRPVYLMEAGARREDAGEVSVWLSGLKRRGLQCWLVGEGSASDTRHGLDIATLRFTSMPFAALSECSTVVVPSANDVLVATAAAAAGSGVLVRAAAERLSGLPGLVIAENPGRAASLFDAGIPTPSTDQVFAVRRSLLDYGATNERMFRLAELLDLPIMNSLRKQVRTSLLAPVPDGEAGKSFATDALRQTRQPRDIVVATDEPPDAPWLDELRSQGVAVALRPLGSKWSELASAARQSLLAVWRHGLDVTTTDLADIELMHTTSSRVAACYRGGMLPADRATLLTQMRPVRDGLPIRLE